MKHLICTSAACFSLLAALPSSSSKQALAQSAGPARLHGNGAELHYIEQGEGEPLILLHGGQGDYRAWQPQMEALASRFRVDLL